MLQTDWRRWRSWSESTKRHISISADVRLKGGWVVGELEDARKKAVRLRGQVAIQNMHAQSKLNGLDGMSMDEINAEIEIVRAEFGKRAESVQSKA